MARMRWIWVPALVLLLAVGDASVYLYVAHAQRRKIDRQLNSVAINVVNAAATSASPTSDIASIQLPDLDPFAANGAYIQVLNTSGSGVMQSPALNNVYLSPPGGAVNVTCSSGPVFYDTTFLDGPVRVMSVPFFERTNAGTSGCKALGSIQVVAPLGDEKHVLAVVRDILLGFGGAELLLLVGGVWVVRRWSGRMGRNAIPADVTA